LSKILDLGNKHEKLVEVLNEYETALEGVEKILSIKGKRLETANTENPSWQHFYDQKRIELHTLTKYFEAEVQRVRGKLFRAYKENHSRELSEREIGRYIDNEEAYLSMNTVYLEVKELHDKYQAAVDAFTSRGYALNNITKIRCSSLENVEL
jgi:hypothetical protein